MSQTRCDSTRSNKVRDVISKRPFQSTISKVAKQILTILATTAILTPAAAADVEGHYGKFSVKFNMQNVDYLLGNG